MYRVSKNYERLHKLIKMGKTIICFVDYNPIGCLINPSRDICKAVLKNKEISFSARGICYASISEWENQSFNYFKKVCELINIEWVL